MGFFLLGEREGCNPRATPDEEARRNDTFLLNEMNESAFIVLNESL